MAVKKTGSRRTSLSRKRKSTRSRKPKIALDTTSVLILTGAIALGCATLLLVNALLSKPAYDGTGARSKTAVVSEQKTEKSKANKTTTASSRKTSSASSASSKKSPEKPVSIEMTPEAAGSSNSQSSSKPSQTASSSSSSSSSSSGTSSGKTSDSSKNKAAQKITADSSKQVASVKPVQSTKPAAPALTQKFPEIPQAVNGARLVFVIDDAGQNVANVKKYTALPMPVTIAVLPRLVHSKDCAYVIRSSGKELILHQPMKGHGNWDPGAGAVLPESTASEIESTIRENLAEIGPGVKGFNNHEGSAITADLLKMESVLDVARTEGIYFIDSRTTSDSQARQAALEHDITIFERNAPFIDNTISRDAMKKEILAGLEIANKRGYAIMIGHVDKSVAILPQLLSEMYPELVKKGYVFCTPSMLR